MAENVSFLHHRDVSIVNVEVRTANRRGSDANDGVARIQYLRFWHVFHPHRMFSNPADRSHPFLLFIWPFPTGWPSVVGISPASINALNRSRSSSTCSSGSSPNIFAMAAPNFPMGGT